jgi:hypothetical protein
MKLFYTLLFLLMIAFYSCSVFEPSSPEAGYLTLDSFRVSTDYATQGSASNSITDVWVIVDNAYLGTFPLPAKVPIPGPGAKKITLRAGIYENGIAAIRSAYPKYSSFDTKLVLEAGKENKVLPQITYLAANTFLQIENFDDASLTLTNTSASNSNLQVTSIGDPAAYEGNSGYALLDANHAIFEVASSSLLQFSQAVPTYIELDYKSENDFNVGVFIHHSSGQVEQRTLLTLRAATFWKKAYISVADLGGMETNAAGYKVFIRCDKSSSLPTAKLYVDNLKVVY